MSELPALQGVPGRKAPGFAASISGKRALPVAFGAITVAFGALPVAHDAVTVVFGAITKLLDAIPSRNGSETYSPPSLPFQIDAGAPLIVAGR